MKTKLRSAFLFGLNAKPWNNGGNYTLKRRLLGLFSKFESVNSLVFQRYLPKLAQTWNMPSDNRQEQETIFDRVLQMRTFNKKDTQPKQSNWFAWSCCARTQLGEFWGNQNGFRKPIGWTR